MSSLREFQEAFGAAVRGAPAVPKSIRAAEPIPLERRMDVYRNNVHASLIDGLEQAFPVVLQLVGQEFFRAMAREFLRDHMPERGTLIGFGDSLPEFLDAFPPVASLPYLGDVARLELLWLRSYHAADDRPVTPEEVAAVPAEELPDLRFGLHSSVETLKSHLPVLSFWRAHQPGQNPASLDPAQEAESVLLLRTNLSVVAHPIGEGALVFIGALRTGQSLGVAATAGANAQSDFELSQILHLLVSGGGFTRLIRS